MCKRQRWDFHKTFLCNAVQQCAQSEIHKAQFLAPLFLGAETYQLRWPDHVVRIPPNRWTNPHLLSTPTWKDSTGQLRTRWHDYISDLAQSRFGVELELPEVAINRKVFKGHLELLPMRSSQKK